MRALRVVGVTEGGDVVLEDPGRRERFTVPADEQLRAAARGDLTRLGQIAIELESQLRPREIQARIRAGASVEQVASAAGVPIQKIERFAYPVLLERSRTAEVAQRAHPVRGDGPDVRTLGDVVAHTFGLRGQEYAEAEWDSWKGEDGKWLVALSWRAGRSDNSAHWTFQPGAHGGTVTAVDEHASDLVEGLPARPLRPVGPVIDIARPDELPPAPEPAALRATASDSVRDRALVSDYRGTTDRRVPTDRAPADRTPVDRAPVDRAPADRVPADRTPAEPMPGDRMPTDRVPERRLADDASADRTPVDRTPAQDSSPVDGSPVDTPAADSPAADSRTERRPVDDAPVERVVVDQAPAVDDSTGRAPEQASEDRDRAVDEATRGGAVPPAQRRAEAPAPAPAAPPAPRAEPRPDEVAHEEPAPEQSAPAAAAPEEPTRPAETPPASRRTKKGKPVMPSWDEVLLGVRGQR